MEPSGDTSRSASTSVGGAELRCASSSIYASFIDFGLPSEARLAIASADGVPGVGGEMKSLKELSVTLGAFQGNLRSDMHANMMAKDHTSAGCGSYLERS